MNIDEEIKMLKDKLYELENAPLPYEGKHNEVEIEEHPAIKRAESPLLNYLDMHPQEITNKDWAEMYAHAFFFPVALILIMIFLAIIDY